MGPSAAYQQCGLPFNHGGVPVAASSSPVADNDHVVPEEGASGVDLVGRGPFLLPNDTWPRSGSGQQQQQERRQLRQHQDIPHDDRGTRRVVSGSPRTPNVAADHAGVGVIIPEDLFG